MGFFPVEQVGFVSLTNLEPSASALFNFSIQASLLSRLYGLNTSIPALAESFLPVIAEAKAKQAADTKPIDRSVVEPYLGQYSQGFQLRLDRTDGLRLEHDIRSFPVLALESGGYLTTGGPSAIAPRKVVLATSDNGKRTMTLDGFEPVRWLTAD